MNPKLSEREKLIMRMAFAAGINQIGEPAINANARVGRKSKGKSAGGSSYDFDGTDEVRPPHARTHDAVSEQTLLPRIIAHHPVCSPPPLLFPVFSLSLSLSLSLSSLFSSLPDKKPAVRGLLATQPHDVAVCTQIFLLLREQQQHLRRLLHLHTALHDDDDSLERGWTFVETNSGDDTLG